MYIITIEHSETEAKSSIYIQDSLWEVGGFVEEAIKAHLKAIKDIVSEDH